jgi:HlyD family secretion protein
MRRRIAVIALLGLATVAAGLTWVRISGRRHPAREDLARVAVRRADLNVSLTASGRVESTKKTIVECELENLAYSNEGRSLAAGGSTVLELVDEGTLVQKNDVLCRFDSSDYEELVRQQEIKVQQATNDFEKAGLDVKAAEMTLIEYRDGTLPEQLQGLDSQIILGQSEVRRQTDRLDWTRQMLKNGYLSAGQVTAEVDKLLRAEVSLDNARGQREQLRKHISPVAILRMEIAIAQAKSLLAFQEMRLQRNRMQLKKFRRQVELCTVHAPHDGFVIYANEGGPRVEVGLRVFQKMKLFFLPDLGQMEVQAVLNETVVDRVREKMGARVRIESLPNYSIEGHVVSIAPLPYVRRDLPPGSDVRSYVGTIRLHSSPHGLLPGMTAEVDILTGRHERALVVPAEAVVAESGRDYCYVDGHDGLERREVVVGEGTRQLVEVRSGLDEGEQVIRDPSQLDSDEIEIANSHDRGHEDSSTGTAAK